MPVLYKKVQSKRTGRFQNKWYGRAVHAGEVDTAQLATMIEEMCTVTEADVLAVLNALVKVMTRSLQNSLKVRLNGFGAFKIGLRTKPADTPEAFTVLQNVAGLHVNFLPEVKIDQNKQRLVTFLRGARLRETAPNSVPVTPTDTTDTPNEAQPESPNS